MTRSFVWQSLYWAWLASEVAILVFTRTRNSSGNTRDRGSLLILWPAIAISLTIGIFYGETRPHTINNGASWVSTLSLCILAIGLAIRWTAVLTLGKSFSANVAIHATQTVHKTGLFRFVRHPSYSGLLLIFIAIGLHTRNWIALAIVFIPPTVALLYRIHVEEDALRLAFGREYEDYSRSTKRLIPGIY